MTAPAGWVDDGKLLPQREQWEFDGRTAYGSCYRWVRHLDDGTVYVHVVPVDEFWPAPKPPATIRPNSILDWINRRFFERPEPGTKQYARGGVLTDTTNGAPHA